MIGLIRLRYRVSQRSPLRGGRKSNSMPCAAQRDRNAPARGFGDRVDDQVIPLGAHASQRMEIPADESGTLVRKRNHTPHTGKILKDIGGLRVCHCEIDGGASQQLMNAPDQRGEKDGGSKPPVDAANQDGGNVLRHERGGESSRADEPRDRSAQKQAYGSSKSSQNSASVQSAPMSNGVAQRGGGAGECQPGVAFS